MGYTHYWQRPANSVIDADAWVKICKDAMKIIEASPCRLGNDEEPADDPEVTDEHIRLNGVGEEGHETFCFTRVAGEEGGLEKGTTFEFCKTAHKPYDQVVCAILTIAKNHLGDDIKVSSDGEFGDWFVPVDWAAITLGRGLKVPVRDDE